MAVSPNYVPIELDELLTGPAAPLNQDGVSVTAQLIVDCRCHLGECVLYDDQRNCVLFESILDRTFLKLDLNHPLNPVSVTKLPKMLGAFAMVESTSSSPEGPQETQTTYLAAWEDGFQLYDLEANRPISTSSTMSSGECVNPLGLPDRLNDGRVDPSGKFFVCGGCAGNDTNTPVKVFQCWYNADTKQLEHAPVVDEIRTTNSICWSPDGKTMYLADSPELKIHQYDYDVTSGDISNKRAFHTKPQGFPDGSCVDSQGFVWNATWRQGLGTAMVHRLDPNSSEIVFTVHLPDSTSEASCCCFGGTNLDILFITTAREHLDPNDEIHSGGLYAVKLPSGMRGLPEKRFRLCS